MQLSAELIDGTIVDGESNIPRRKKIKRVFSSPEHQNRRRITHDETDVIILGPGSLLRVCS
ncbi:MAG: 2-phospho-L-lactate transferase CofD family protein [Veillonella sp.]